MLVVAIRDQILLCRQAISGAAADLGCLVVQLADVIQIDESPVVGSFSRMSGLREG
jgi:hypothetical protein